MEILLATMLTNVRFQMLIIFLYNIRVILPPDNNESKAKYSVKEWR